LSGTTNVFLIRFMMKEKHGMMPWVESFYFSGRVNKSLSV
jgi:hypothetical protein